MPGRAERETSQRGVGSGSRVRDRTLCVRCPVRTPHAIPCRCWPGARSAYVSGGGLPEGFWGPSGGVLVTLGRGPRMRATLVHCRSERGVMDTYTRDSFLSPDEVARRIRLSRRAVYDAIRRGELPAMRLCGRLRISPADLEAWLAAGATRARRPAIPASTSAARKPTPAPGSFRALMAEGSGKRNAA